MNDLQQEKASLICSIFSALDEINPGWDAKEVWNNLKQKSTAEVRAVYERTMNERKKLLEK